MTDECDRLFVLLHHLTADGEHYDLCLEAGEKLATWRLPRQAGAPPESLGTGPLEARRLADHRRAYLDYEGPIGGDRGRVIRIDRGPLTIHEASDTRWTFRLQGACLNGMYRLSARPGTSDLWSFARLEDPGQGIKAGRA